MRQNELEKRLKKINPHFNIRQHNNIQGANDGLYFGNLNICAVPSGHIWQNKCYNYQGLFGVVHRSLEELTDLLLNRGLITYRDKLTLLRP